MNWLQGLLYGLVSGLSEFLPVSTEAHQVLLRYLCGIDNRNPLMDLLIHMASLAGLLVSSGAMLEQLKRSSRIYQRTRRINTGVLDLRFIKSAGLSLLIAMIVLLYSTDPPSLPVLTLLLIINGIAIIVPSYMLQGNKDSRSMSRLDAVLLGVASALAVVPGFSRVGCGTAWAISRGADRNKAVHWLLLLSIPALALAASADFIAIFSASHQTAISGPFIGYILAAGTAFVSSYWGILLLRFLAVNTGFRVFAYYSWGAALFTFIMYLL